MKYLWDLIFWFLLLWRISALHAQASSYYKRTYYSGVPSTRYLYSNHRSSAAIKPTDLVPQESKRKDKFSKHIRPYVSSEDEYSQEQYLSSAEYSNESPVYNPHSHSIEQDSREISVGTHFRVQHPISVPKKNSYSTLPKKQTSRPVASELRTEPTKKRVKTQNYYDADPFHVVPPPKSTSTAGYNVYEDDQDIFVPKTRNKATAYDRFKGVASKKQVDKYLEDQEKYLDEALKNQLLHNPKYHKYLDALEEDNERDLYDADYTANPPPALRGHYNNNKANPPFKNNRPRRRPATDLKRLPKRLPNRKYRSAIVINV